MKNIPIGEVLKEYGYITEQQISRALEIQKQSKENKRLGQILIDLGYITEPQMLQALSQRLGYRLINMDTVRVDTEAVSCIPRQLAQKYNLIALQKLEGRLQLVMSDPLNFYAVEDVRQVTGMPLEILIAPAAAVARAINASYAEIEARMQASQIQRGNETEMVELALEEEDDNAASVVKLLNSLLNQGYVSGASDIHIEPFETKTMVRMRVDGTIREYVTLPVHVHASLVARIKILGGLDIAEKRLPQDGHFRTNIEGADVNLRVSLIPTVYGEKAVLRYLSTNTPIDRSNHFGMDEANFRKMLQMLRSPHGIIYITGPTGSGKTTTLYMILEAMCNRQFNISTIEDPVERNIAKINQMQVNTMAGLTFDVGLRALLRQDPDVIMVGETRDAETASISVRAAITGHLVFSTLHTNDAVSSIMRLEDMGLPEYMVSGSLVGIMAQRLLRKVCPYCQEEYELDDIAREAIGDKTITHARRGRGCNFCKGAGYKGRIAIHEILIADREVRRMILAGTSAENITKYAVEQQGMTTLRQSAQNLVRSGITTVDELLKVTYSVE